MTAFSSLRKNREGRERESVRSGREKLLNVEETRQKPDRVACGCAREWARRRNRLQTRYVPAMLLSDRISSRFVSPDIRRTKANYAAREPRTTSHEPQSRAEQHGLEIGFLVYLGICVRTLSSASDTTEFI